MRACLHRSCFVRTISLSLSRSATQIPPSIKIKEEDIEEAFVKGSGPGEQKSDKTSSAVQLKHLPTGLVVKYQATRSRSQNRQTLRRSLADNNEKASKTKKARRKYRRLEAE